MGPYDERRASEEEKKKGLGREDGARASFLPRAPSLSLSHLDSLAFLLAAVFVRYHQSRAWNRLGGCSPEFD